MLILLLLLLLVHVQQMTSTSLRQPQLHVPALPTQLLVAYANWNQCDEMLPRAAQHGANVLIWFSINLSAGPAISNGPDMDCVARRVTQISRERESEGLPEVVHLISIGGWNSPHPDTAYSAEQMLDEWERWNSQVVARPELGFFGFHGFDWDVEGNDTPTSPYNHFSVECLDLMGRMSQLAKQRGYIVAMAPAESYLDPTRPTFDRSLLHEYDEWKGIIPTFAYHGLNSYAYLIARYGTYESNDSIRNTFDFITVQLYEGYSHAEYRCSIEKIPPHRVLSDFVRSMIKSYSIDFSNDVELNFPFTKEITVAPTQLVVGLANGWAGDGKFLLIYPDEVELAFKKLQTENEAPRGFAFWNILDEGRASQQRPNEPLWLAIGLNKFLNTQST